MSGLTVETILCVIRVLAHLIFHGQEAKLEKQKSPDGFEPPT